MEKYPVISEKDKLQLSQFFCGIFRKKYEECKSGKVNIRIPQSLHLYETHVGMAYHFKPEMFIQTGGYTEFHCPDKIFETRDSEICIMPKGVPHGEVAYDSGKDFENVVVCFYSHTITVHLARMGECNKPEAKEIFFFKSDYYDDLLALLNRCAALSHTNLKMAKEAIQSLLSGFFALLINMFEVDMENHTVESQRIYQCRWLIRNHFKDSELSVGWLANNLACSSNYLSKIFHEEIGVKITTYITDIRLRNALDVLRTTSLSVKEISNVCGFRDPNYFSRIFKQNYGKTPLEYRNELDVFRNESKPKVVYSDREEYHYGYDRENRLIKGE